MTKLNILKSAYKTTILLLLILSIGRLSAQTIITDRPDQTESSSTIEKGSIQIESGVLIGFTDEDSETQRQLLAPSTLFRIGITKGIELRVLNQFESVKLQKSTKEINGVSDLEIGTKIQFLRNEDINTEIAFLSHLILPTGSSDLTNDEWGTINKLSISHQLNDKIGLGYNIGYNNFGKGNGDLTYSVAIGFGITEQVALYIEPYGDLTEFENHVSNFDAGITYLVKDNLQLDFSFGTGINYNMNYISVGFSWNIKDIGGTKNKE